MQSYQFKFNNSKSELTITILVAKFDAARVAEFKDSLKEKWNEAIQVVNIDFAQVDFIDSSGIGALLGVQKKLKQSSSPIAILNAKPNIVSVIELLRLQRVFSIHA